jgi:hypothetical protein
MSINFLSDFDITEERLCTQQNSYRTHTSYQLLHEAFFSSVYGTRDKQRLDTMAYWYINIVSVHEIVQLQAVTYEEEGGM